MRLMDLYGWHFNTFGGRGGAPFATRNSFVVGKITNLMPDKVILNGRCGDAEVMCTFPVDSLEQANSVTSLLTAHQGMILQDLGPLELPEPA